MRADLATLQQQFADGLLDAGLVANLLPAFAGSAELNRERFAFYRGNIHAIWLQSLSNAFPVLQQLVGSAFFDDLCRAYGLAYPSQSGNLNEFGVSMAKFIDTLENCRPYPYLSDVAELEWQIHAAYYASHEGGVTLEQLAAVNPDKLSLLTVALQPCCALVASPWAIHAIWHAHQSDEPGMPAELASPCRCLVWRQPSAFGWKVQLRELSDATYTALTALKNGETLGTALEQAFATDPEFAFQRELADWLNMQLITSINLNEGQL